MSEHERRTPANHVDGGPRGSREPDDRERWSASRTRSRVGVAVVGCGAIGAVHAQLVAELEGAELVGLVDVRADVAGELADRAEDMGASRPRVYATLDEALHDPAVELVVLTTPSGLHASQANEVMDAKRHLLVEKPLDTDLSRARQLADRARTLREEGVVASVVSQHRFDASSRVVADALEHDAFGAVTTAIASTAWWRSQDYYDSATWRGTQEFDGGGALMNQSVHIVDLLLSFLGRPLEVFGFASLAAHDRIDVEDCAVATIAFSSGAIASLHATTAAYPGLTTRLQLMGARGSAIIEDDELTYLHSAGSSNEDVGLMGLTLSAGNDLNANLPRNDGTRAKPAQYQLDPSSHRAQYLDLLRAIDIGGEPRVTVQDAFHALALIKSVYAAIALRRPVAFDDVVSGLYDHVTAQIV